MTIKKSNFRPERSLKKIRDYMVLQLLDFIPVTSRGDNSDPEFSNSFAFTYRDIALDNEISKEKPFRAPSIKAA